MPGHHAKRWQEEDIGSGNWYFDPGIRQELDDKIITALPHRPDSEK